MDQRRRGQRASGVFFGFQPRVIDGRQHRRHVAGRAGFPPAPNPPFALHLVLLYFGQGTQGTLCKQCGHAIHRKPLPSNPGIYILFMIPFSKWRNWGQRRWVTQVVNRRSLGFEFSALCTGLAWTTLIVCELWNKGVTWVRKLILSVYSVFLAVYGAPRAGCRILWRMGFLYCWKLLYISCDILYVLVTFGEYFKCAKWYACRLLFHS